jgi:hypothetical protein
LHVFVCDLVGIETTDPEVGDGQLLSKKELLLGALILNGSEESWDRFIE